MKKNFLIACLFVCYNFCAEGASMPKSLNEKENSIFTLPIQRYLPPYFKDNDRLKRIQVLFPEIDEMYRKHAEKNSYPGYAYGILLDGILVYSGSGGFIDIEKKIPATPQSMFRIASMTKSFTAMAILKLRDDGKLRLDDPIDLYIPEMRAVHLTADEPAITIRDLLMHSAGFPTDDPWADRKLDETKEHLFTLLKEKINFSNPPGIVFEYSNLGYTILGYLIKKITGISHQEFISTTICQPLEIESYWEYEAVPKAQLVHGYTFKNKKLEEEPLLHDGIYGAMGGLITSIESFSRYVVFHQAAWPPRNDEELGPIKRSSIREMHQPWKFIKLETGLKYACEKECSLVSAYGYGLKWLKDSLGRIFLGHRGGLPGFGSNWFFLPEYGLGIISFANITYADTSKIDLEVLNKLLIESKLQSRHLPPSDLLKDSQSKLLSLLPDWENVVDGIFAENFFLDRPLKSLQEESKDLFLKIGNIISIDEVIPENQLRGYFILRGEKADLQINFALTPENPCLIQQYQIKEINF
jgi:CubicO group peptidase (beta-lactamase class C family)